MENQELNQKIVDLESKIDQIYKSVEKTRKYFLAVLIISIIMVVLPAVGLIFVVPSFLSIYSGFGF